MASKSTFRIAAACLATSLGFAAFHGQFKPAPVAQAASAATAKPCVLADSEQLPWANHDPAWRLQHVPGAQPGTYQEVSRLLTPADWKALSPKFRNVALHRLRDVQSGRMPVALCFAPGTDPAVVKAFRHMDSALSFFRLSTRWTSTATMPSVSQGHQSVQSPGVRRSAIRQRRQFQAEAPRHLCPIRRVDGYSLCGSQLR
jgi:hypothetical protein